MEITPQINQIERHPHYQRKEDLEIMNELEDAFDIKLESDEDVATIDDVVKYVKKQLDNK